MIEMKNLNFTVEGPAVPKARTRFSNNRCYTPKKTKEFERLIGLMANLAMAKISYKPTSGQVFLSVTCYFTPLKTWSDQKILEAKLDKIPHLHRPDSSNLLKSIEDGMNGIVYDDDCQIVQITFKKKYGPKDLIDINIWGEF